MWRKERSEDGRSQVNEEGDTVCMKDTSDGGKSIPGSLKGRKRTRAERKTEKK